MYLLIIKEENFKDLILFLLIKLENEECSTRSSYICNITSVSIIEKTGLNLYNFHNLCNISSSM